jgi:hypothetical protein
LLNYKIGVLNLNESRPTPAGGGGPEKDQPHNSAKGDIPTFHIGVSKGLDVIKVPSTGIAQIAIALATMQTSSTLPGWSPSLQPSFLTTCHRLTGCHSGQLQLDGFQNHSPALLHKEDWNVHVGIDELADHAWSGNPNQKIPFHRGCQGHSYKTKTQGFNFRNPITTQIFSWLVKIEDRFFRKGPTLVSGTKGTESWQNVPPATLPQAWSHLGQHWESTALLAGHAKKPRTMEMSFREADFSDSTAAKAGYEQPAATMFKALNDPFSGRGRKGPRVGSIFGGGLKSPCPRSQFLGPR